MISKKTGICLFCAVVLAIGLMLFYVWEHTDLTRRIAEISAQSEIVSASWNRINDEKLELQEELNEKTGIYRNAEMILKENGEDRIARLRSEVEKLQKETDALREQVEAMDLD